MADKYTKVLPPASPTPKEPAEDAWKDYSVEKEVTPAKVKSNVTYRQLEAKVGNLDVQIATIEASKAEVEAEMAKVKTAAEKE